jgi:hypothetical protein
MAQEFPGNGRRAQALSHSIDIVFDKAAPASLNFDDLADKLKVVYPSIFLIH